MAAEELRLLWDGTLRQSHAVSRSHFFDAYVALAVHTTRTRTENWESLVELLSEYATLDEVVAIGETGISLQTAGDADPWTLKEQRMVVGEQMRVARETGLPVLCHTPSDMKSNETAFIRSKTEGGHDHAPDAGSQAGDSLAAETAKRGATEISVQIADDVGLPDEQLVIDHASSQITPFVLESTGCYLSFSVGSTIHEVNIEAVADAIDRYGPDRILIDSDITGMAEINPFAMKEAILDLLRLGVSPADVRRVIYENPREILGLSDLPE
ncbi:TatD family hydrolase [Natronorarus salvus]|uniref:TatD family hydrolase n=1 Tax=Natronorarus salvus TaxID=3117733 RepID=UPI002F2694D2